MKLLCSVYGAQGAGAEAGCRGDQGWGRLGLAMALESWIQCSQQKEAESDFGEDVEGKTSPLCTGKIGIGVIVIAQAGARRQNGGI